MRERGGERGREGEKERERERGGEGERGRVGEWGRGGEGEREGDCEGRGGKKMENFKLWVGVWLTLHAAIAMFHEYVYIKYCYVN